MQKQANILEINWNQTRIERRARFIVNQDYHNAHFSDRIWRDTRELSRRIKRNIEPVVIQGKNPREFAKKLRDLVSKDIKKIIKKTDVITIRYNKDKGWHMYPDYPSKKRGFKIERNKN